MTRHPTTEAGGAKGAGSRGRAVAGLLVLLLVASAGLNLWYASHGLDRSRYWDERFSLDNVRSLLVTGSLRPANGYYQSLSYLPQAALLAALRSAHRWTGWEPLAVFGEGREFSPTSYLVCRSLQVLYGAGCLVLTFLVGRRLFSRAVGLVGAFLLAVTPWFVQGATMYKPDILVVLAVLSTLYWSLGAVERGNFRGYALAGCGVALAASAKLTGVLAGIPLLVGTLLSWRGSSRSAVLLLAAGAAGAVAFAVLNPYFTLYPSFLSRNLEIYDQSAAESSSTRLTVLWRVVELVVSWAAHGRVVGTLALAGGGVLAFRLLGRKAAEWQGFRRVQGWMLLSLPVGYPVTYALLTPEFRSHNFLPVLPFTALLAAWIGVRGAQVAAQRVPALGRRWAAFAAAGAMVSCLAPVPFLYVYRAAVPSTEELARNFLHRRFVEQGETRGRLVYSETEGVAEPSKAAERLGKGGGAVAPVTRLRALPPREREGADGAIFPASRLHGEGSELYWRRLARVPPAAVRRIEPGFLSARGAPRIAVASPWRLVESERLYAGLLPGPVEGGLEVPVPAPQAGEAFSFAIALHGTAGRPRLEVGSRTVELWRVLGAPGVPPTYVSAKLPAEAPEGPEDGGSRALRLRPSPGATGELAVALDLLRWMPSEGGDP